MLEAMDGREKEGRRRELSQEAIAFMLDLGICPGSRCPFAKGGCDPRCRALESWVENVVDG